MHILVIVSLFIGFIGSHINGYGPKAQSVVVIEDGMIMGNTLPRWGTICDDVNVQGDPYPYTAENTLYSLKAGERVRLMEQFVSDEQWVMIDGAEWIPIKVVCGFGGTDE